MKIGTFLRKKRKSLNKKQSDIANLLQIDPSLISRWENNDRSIYFDDAINLLTLYRCSKAEIFTVIHCNLTKPPTCLCEELFTNSQS